MINYKLRHLRHIEVVIFIFIMFSFYSCACKYSYSSNEKIELMTTRPPFTIVLNVTGYGISNEINLYMPDRLVNYKNGDSTIIKYVASNIIFEGSKDTIYGKRLYDYVNFNSNEISSLIKQDKPVILTIEYERITRSIVEKVRLTDTLVRKRACRTALAH